MAFVELSVTAHQSHNWGKVSILFYYLSYLLKDSGKLKNSCFQAICSDQFSHSVMSDSLWPHGLQRARLPCPSPTPRACSDSLFFKSVMSSNHLILCHPLVLLLPVFPSIRVFSNESVLCIRWPKYWRFSFSISPSNEYSRLISLGWTGLTSLQPKGLSRLFSNTTVQSIDSLALSFLYSPTLAYRHDYWRNHSFDYMDLCR